MIQFAKTLRSFRFAAGGIHWLFRYENNARVHLLAALVVIGVGFWLRISRTDWLWLLLAIALVWTAEMFNTALEKVVDLVSPEYHPLAGQAKDLAAGAVLLTALFAVVVGVLVLGPYVVDVFA
ncbi:undecaprenol kinase/diacylglycerol kinase (ATP) [Catalinimonas alkaloidigena]|uniref:Undecaprenol kinase/diacylglycerol kinase (ATP) n=1 Tax=Catalinimonas alkaloidigena TaxID=1075417 RepID=A0A1G9PAA9_9BACT|nr:diacylglycerol kinase family protein [Catalinimonas alkaloidigena]SDL95718.1 undecaprenol kinase/diacylglycerol kinase (ATP) [Catalinimonas alkaloidigena]